MVRVQKCVNRASELYIQVTRQLLIACCSLSSISRLICFFTLEFDPLEVTDNSIRPTKAIDVTCSVRAAPPCCQTWSRTFASEHPRERGNWAGTADNREQISEFQERSKVFCDGNPWREKRQVCSHSLLKGELTLLSKADVSFKEIATVGYCLSSTEATCPPCLSSFCS